MGFGSGNSINLKKPSLRSNIIQDMESVVAGKTGLTDNSLLSKVSQLKYGVSSITQDGQFIAMINHSYINGSDIIGYKEKIEINTNEGEL